jgi:hypothetical protein
MNKDDDQDHNIMTHFSPHFFTKKDLASPTHTKVLLFFNEPSILRNLTVDIRKYSGGCYEEVLGSIKLVGPTSTFS